MTIHEKMQKLAAYEIGIIPAQLRNLVESCWLDAEIDEELPTGIESLSSKLMAHCEVISRMECTITFEQSLTLLRDLTSNYAEEWLGDRHKHIINIRNTYSREALLACYQDHLPISADTCRECVAGFYLSTTKLPTELRSYSMVGSLLGSIFFRPVSVMMQFSEAEYVARKLTSVKHVLSDITARVGGLDLDDFERMVEAIMYLPPDTFLPLATYAELGKLDRKLHNTLKENDSADAEEEPLNGPLGLQYLVINNDAQLRRSGNYSPVRIQRKLHRALIKKLLRYTDTCCVNERLSDCWEEAGNVRPTDVNAINTEISKLRNVLKPLCIDIETKRKIGRRLIPIDPSQ